MAKCVVDIENLTLDDLIVIEDNREALARNDLRAMRAVLARFIVGDDGERLPESEALAAAGGLPLRQMVAAVQALAEAVEAVSVPNSKVAS
jgi:hypothetical protein